MKTTMTSLSMGLLLIVFAVDVAHGQRGRGEAEGLARQGATPEMVTVSGVLERIETGPCERTTGHAYIGTHLFIRVDDETLINTHLGSAEAMQSYVDHLRVGQPIQIEAFRTGLLEENHYIARTIESEGRAITLRDEDLRPFWAAQRRGDRRSGASRRDGTRGFRPVRRGGGRR